MLIEMELYLRKSYNFPQNHNLLETLQVVEDFDIDF